jgi:hypothetical protein
MWHLLGHVGARLKDICCSSIQRISAAAVYKGYLLQQYTKDVCCSSIQRMSAAAAYKGCLLQQYTKDVCCSSIQISCSCDILPHISFPKLIPVSLLAKPVLLKNWNCYQQDGPETARFPVET